MILTEIYMHRYDENHENFLQNLFVDKISFYTISTSFWKFEFMMEINRHDKNDTHFVLSIKPVKK